MPPRSMSRYLSSLGVKDAAGKLYLTERKRFAFDAKAPGTRLHVVAQGDSLHALAYKYFAPIDNAEHLWWVIAEFQPIPIRDLTLDLAVGRTLYIPSTRIVQERVLGR